MKTNLSGHYTRDEQRLAQLNPELGRLIAEDHESELLEGLKSLLVNCELAKLPDNAGNKERAKAVNRGEKALKRFIGDSRRAVAQRKQDEWLKASKAIAAARINQMARMAGSETPLNLTPFPGNMIPASRQARITSFIVDVLGIDRAKAIFKPE